MFHEMFPSLATLPYDQINEKFVVLMFDDYQTFSRDISFCMTMFPSLTWYFQKIQFNVDKSHAQSYAQWLF